MTSVGVLCGNGHPVVLLVAEREIGMADHLTGEETFAIDVAADEIGRVCPVCSEPINGCVIRAV